MEINDLITILVEQNKSFIEQNNSYKDMLFFAVGSIITILVIFLTANFFTMRKFREEEIEKIQATVMQNIQTHSLPELKKEFITHLELLVESKFNSLESNVNVLKSKFQTTNSSLTDSLNDFKNETERLEGTVFCLKADFYYEHKSYSNAFSYYLDAGKIFLAANSMGMIYSILTNLEKTAEKLNHVMSELTDFHEFTNKLSIEFQPQAKKIADILIGKQPL